MKNNQYPKVFVPSDHMKAERKFWNRMIVVSAVALCLFAYGVAAHFDSQNAADASGIEALR